MVIDALAHLAAPSALYAHRSNPLVSGPPGGATSSTGSATQMIWLPGRFAWSQIDGQQGIMVLERSTGYLTAMDLWDKSCI